MTDIVMRLSPLAHLAQPGDTTPDAVGLEDRCCLSGKFIVHGKADDKAFVEAVSTALGIALPIKPNTVSDNRELAIFWLGPNEWLVTCGVNEETTVVQALEKARVAFTLMSDGWAVIRLAGPRAMDVLKKGCGLDIHPRVLGSGCCARTGLAQCTVMLHRASDEPIFDIYCERSYAEYLWLWLQDAMVEFNRSGSKKVV